MAQVLPGLDITWIRRQQEGELRDCLLASSHGHQDDGQVFAGHRKAPPKPSGGRKQQGRRNPLALFVVVFASPYVTSDNAA